MTKQRWRMGISDQMIIASLVALVLASITLLGDGSPYGAVSVGLFVFSLLWFVKALGTELAIVPVMAVLATGQWLLGPYFAYHFDASLGKYSMYVDEQTYYSFVLPGTLAFLITLQAFSDTIHLSQLGDYLRSTVRIKPHTVWLLFAVGIITSMASEPIAAIGGFVVFLISQITYIAMIFMFIFRMPGRWLAFCVGFGVLVTNSAGEGLFHNLLLWSALILSYICYEFRLSYTVKLIIILLAIILGLQLQAAKGTYREIVLDNPNLTGIQTLFQTMQEASPMRDLGLHNVRLNQGWIISALLLRVPETIPHENGSTIYAAVQDSLVPRLLVDKQQVSVSDKFRLYTGLPVSEFTSFGISVLGEAWVNFGYYGILFMGLFGTALGLSMTGIMRMTRHYPTFVLWTPLIFLQTIKMETELVVVLNHILKTGFFVLAFYFLAYRVFRWRI